MNKQIDSLKKIIKFRLLYSGMKETDILYQKLILNNLPNLKIGELELLSNMLTDIPDIEIFNMLTDKAPKLKKYKVLINKILDEQD